MLELGNLDAQRDWGFAPREYVDGMWRMLPAPRPDTFVLADRPDALRAPLRRAGVRRGRHHAGMARHRSR